MTLLPDDLPSPELLAPGIRPKPGTLILRFTRSGGPGGQNVNKLNTKADLRIHLDDLIGLPPYARQRLEQLAGKRLTAAGELHITAESHRTQEGNRAEALEQLRKLLVQALHRPKPRRKTKPTKGSRERRLESKRRQSQTKRLRRGEI